MKREDRSRLELDELERMEPAISIHSKVEVSRCSEGERLYRAWMFAQDLHSPDDIYAAIRAYFTHKNGTRNYIGKVITPGCCQCGFVIKEK